MVFVIIGLSPLLLFLPTISNDRDSALSANFNNPVTNNIAGKARI
jgi:hypothetical protein